MDPGLTPGARPEPSNPLPPAVRKMWLAESLLSVAVVAVVTLMLAAVTGWFPLPLALVLTAAALAYGLVEPGIRHGRWRWELRDEELDLLRGVWTETRTIVPLTRIQHVSVERSAWTNSFGLVRLHVHTAAGKTTIPGLERAQADEQRDRILARLRTPDDL
jgi:membrane protein YdbS with pleckstrin-like domain